MAGEDPLRSRALQIAEARYAFRWHLLVYAVVNAGLVAIWFNAGTGFPWPIFPIVFWGLGLGAHYLAAYGTVGEDWVKREAEKILQEMKGRP